MGSGGHSGVGTWWQGSVSSLWATPHGPGGACSVGGWLTFFPWPRNLYLSDSWYLSDNWERILVFPLPTTLGECRPHPVNPIIQLVQKINQIKSLCPHWQLKSCIQPPPPRPPPPPTPPWMVGGVPFQWQGREAGYISGWEDPGKPSPVVSRESPSGIPAWHQSMDLGNPSSHLLSGRVGPKQGATWESPRVLKT